MKLITKEQKLKMVANWAEARRDTEDGEVDGSHIKPVVKLFNPCGAGTWLLTEIDPHNERLAFGLADLGLGTPELGYVDLAELASVRTRFGLGIERDLRFEADKTIAEYAEDARRLGYISA